MCIAIYSLKGTNIPEKEILLNCYNANPNGCGFAYSYKNTVFINKGFFSFDAFYDALLQCDTAYNLKEQGVLIHFRIATHGLVDAANCHPFPISKKEERLKSNTVKSGYAVIHNGICQCTSNIPKNEPFSDTVLFVRDYLTKIASYPHWFNNANTMKLIEQLIDSKMAILNEAGNIIATKGFHKGTDGNYYSNYSYQPSYYGCYDFGFYDNWYYDKMPTQAVQRQIPLMELKNGEVIYYDDGTIEEFRQDYHSSYKTFVTEDCDVYVLYENQNVGRTIPISQLSYIGNGIIVNGYHSLLSNEPNTIAFREDAVAVV